jgi:hypothetical protein
LDVADPQVQRGDLIVERVRSTKLNAGGVQRGHDLATGVDHLFQRLPP